MVLLTPNVYTVYSDKTRYLTNIMFNRRWINGEIIVRSWLVYSPSLGVVFCRPCRIFQTSLETQLVIEGFNDWKNGYYLLATSVTTKIVKSTEMLLLI